MGRRPAPNPIPDRHNSDPARVLTRRLRAKMSYRRRRDRKIAVDWLGREFEFALAGGNSGVHIRIESYNPDTADMVVRFMTGWMSPTTVNFPTDWFWKLLRSGRLEQS